MPRRLPLLADRSIQEAHAEKLRIAAEFERGVLSEGKVSCHAGCSNCCYYPLTISILEGINIYQWLAKNHLWTPKLKASFQEAKDKTWDLAPEIWLLSMIPCPLLDEQNRCSAYEVRPLLCRTVYSRGDPYYCHPHRLGSSLTGILSRILEVDELHLQEAKILKRHRLKPLQVSLAAAVLLGERIVKKEVDLEETNSTLLQEYVQRL